MAQLWGTLALRLANADVLPLRRWTNRPRACASSCAALDKIPNLAGNLDTSPLVERTRALRAAARRLDHAREHRARRRNPGARRRQPR